MFSYLLYFPPVGYEPYERRNLASNFPSAVASSTPHKRHHHPLSFFCYLLFPSPSTSNPLTRSVASSSNIYPSPSTSFHLYDYHLCPSHYQPLLPKHLGSRVPLLFSLICSLDENQFLILKFKSDDINHPLLKTSKLFLCNLN